MTVVNPKSISGINSITTGSGSDDLLTIHTNNGTERLRVDSTGATKIVTGIVTTLTATTGIVTSLEATTGDITTLRAPTGIVTSLIANTARTTTGIVTSLEATTGNITTLRAPTGIVTTFVTNTAKVGAAVTISSDGIDAVGVAITCSTLNGGAFSNRRININGDMSVWQRSAYAGTSAMAVASQTQINTSIDNMLWRAGGSDGTGAFSVVQEAVTDLPEFYYCAKLLCTTADTVIANGAYHSFWPVQIEGLDANRLMWGTSNAKNVVYSFYVKSNKTGSYGGSVGNAGNNRSFPFNYTINSANTWERKVIKIPGDTTGTWNRTNELSIKVTMSLGSGSNYTGTANQWNAAEDMAPTSHVNWMDSTSNNYYITGVQFEEGDEVTPFEHRPFIEEILLCQRYFQTIVSLNGKAMSHVYINGYSTDTIELMAHYKVPMRTSHSIGIYGQMRSRSGNGADLETNLAGSTFSGDRYGQGGHFWATKNSGSSWTAFSTHRLSGTDGTNVAIELSAKLS